MAHIKDTTQISGGGRKQGKDRKVKKKEKQEKKHASERDHSWSRVKRDEAEGQVHLFPYPGHPSWEVAFGNGQTLKSCIGFVESSTGQLIEVRTMNGPTVPAKVRKGKVNGIRVDYDSWNEHLTRSPLPKLPVPSESIVVAIQEVIGGWAVVYIYTPDEIDIMTDAKIFDALYDAHDEEFEEYFGFEEEEAPPTVEEILVARLTPKVARGSYEEDMNQLAATLEEEEEDEEGEEGEEEDEEGRG